MNLLKFLQPVHKQFGAFEAGFEDAKRVTLEVIEQLTDYEYLDYELPNDTHKQWLSCSKSEYEQYKASDKIVRRFVILEEG